MACSGEYSGFSCCAGLLFSMNERIKCCLEERVVEV